MFYLSDTLANFLISFFSKHNLTKAHWHRVIVLGSLEKLTEDNGTLSCTLQPVYGLKEYFATDDQLFKTSLMKNISDRTVIFPIAKREKLTPDVFQLLKDAEQSMQLLELQIITRPQENIIEYKFALSVNGYDLTLSYNSSLA